MNQQKKFLMNQTVLKFINQNKQEWCEFNNCYEIAVFNLSVLKRNIKKINYKNLCKLHLLKSIDDDYLNINDYNKLIEFVNLNYNEKEKIIITTVSDCNITNSDLEIVKLILSKKKDNVINGKI